MVFWSKFLFATAVLLSSWGVVERADAQTPKGLQVQSAWSDSDVAAVRLIAGADGPTQTGRIPLGLEFDLAEGWKVYWRSPGDAGYPPELADQGSENLASLNLMWPAPERFSIFGLETFGYAGQPILPLQAVASDPAAPVAIRQKVAYLACSDICVPFEADLALTLDGPAQPTGHVQGIDRAAGQIPIKASLYGASIKATLLSEGEAQILSVSVDGLAADGADILIEGPLGTSFGKPAITPTQNGLQATLAVQGTAEDLTDGTGLRVTVLTSEADVEQSLTLGAADASESNDFSWLVIIATALLGGLILNLMPCVLPVLSLKIMQVAEHRDSANRDIRLGFLASSAGIVAFMLALAGALIALKQGGAAIGWGIQFQEPLVLGFMVVVLLLFAANLFGFFEFALPRRVSDTALKASNGSGLAGQFGQGAFAALLATPCSAPFVGTAVSFALARGPLEILVIFAALGLGLAAPFLLVATAPVLVRHLPKPGAWMIKLRWVLGLALVGTALWLVSILWSQAGLIAAAAIGIGGLALLAILSLRESRGRKVWAGAAAVAVLTLSTPVWLSADAGVASPSAARDEANWAAFDPALIQHRVQSGEVVLVDVTADWCLTCKVNKRLVLDGDAVADLLASGDLTGVRADWTNPDDQISRYLAGFGRYGIPFNAVYGPGAPDGIALPELLSDEAVLSAIQKAQSG